MGYISAQQAATKWGISKRRVQVLCTENRIKNATRIGNMWVVPEDALKPADGRVQTHHTVESPTARAARTALKKLTVNAYQEINGKLNNPSTSKMVFVSLLATTIFCDIQNDESSNEKDDVFLMISSELLEIEFKESSRRSFWEMFSSLVSDFEKYIYRYADYVDDILSWAYQYVNKLSLDSGLESTQFFTEEYMIEYLTKGIPRTTTASSVYLDPACGGGNFLSHILNQLFVLRYRELDNPIACIENIFNALYGYELDPNLAAVASVNLKLKALMLLAKVQQVSTVDWRLFCPNIFTSVEPNGFGFLEADFSTHRIRRVADGKRENLESMTAVATEIYTNPPFQTVKGMASSMKEHLKKHFPNAKCDLCNAFILQCIDKIQTGGTIGLVTQSSWMYLDSFENLRRELITNNTIESIADLGSGAFYDLSGEKANVALVRVTKTPYANACVKVLTLRDIPLKEKAAVLGKASDSVLLMQQTQLFGGEHMAFSLSQTTPNTVHAMPGKYGDYGIPMQGTSTGDAARLIGYYWEHLNDPEWVPVSKGGSYSRWCGLNSYAMFAELASRLTEKDGFAAIIVKSALVTSTCYSSCFRHFVNQGSLSEVFLFDNREKLFQIDSREKFCVLFFGGEHAGGIKVHYGLTKQEQILSSVPINVTSEELELINPETGLLPNVADSKEFSFLLRTHRSLSVFAKEFPKCHFGRLVHLTAHAEHISTKSEKTRVPIYEGKFIEQYDNRFSTFAGMSADERYQAKASARRQPGDSFVAPKPAPECRYFIDKKFWESFLDRYDQPYSLCWRSLTSPTNQRTMIASIIPSMPTCQSVQLLQTTPVEDLLMILALLNSKVFDFFVRLKMGGIDLTQSVVRQIPVPFREAWNSMVTLHGVDYTALDAVRALERLLYRNEPDLCGLWDGVPEIKNADNYYKTAADVREEIDKIIFQMYGLTSAEEKMVRNSFKA